MPKTGLKIILTPPAMETLFMKNDESPWPESILSNFGISTQVELRRSLGTILEKLFTYLPNATTEITIAIDTGAIPPEIAVSFYQLLNEFLNADTHHHRLILYLPFELIPDKNWRPPSESLRMVIDDFTQTYLNGWRKLLQELEVRANFVDGNILEPELCPNGQVMVCKAAHLIPKLVQKHLVDIPEIEALKSGAENEALSDSISDATLLLTNQSPISKPQPISKLISQASINSGWFQDLNAEIAFELKKIAMRSALDNSRGLPPARVAWEQKEKQELLISKYGGQITKMITTNTINQEDVVPHLSPDNNLITSLAIIRGVGEAIEIISESDRTQALSLAEKFMVNIDQTWIDTTPELYDEVESVLVRWTNLGIITESKLQRQGFEIPKLDGPFSMTGPLAIEVMVFAKALREILHRPQFSHFLYPVALFFGSRFKGYARKNADLDVAVFIKPETPFSKRSEIQRILKQIFQSKKIDGKIVEFWLEEQGQEYQIRDFPNPDVLLADSSWIHVLLAGVWLGPQDIVGELHTKLLARYLYPTKKTIKGRNLRTIWLGEIEREVLQYRLMHKGYRRFFAPQGGISGPGTENLDSRSMFWDSGYRRLATKLFIQRVFLPKCS